MEKKIDFTLTASQLHDLLDALIQFKALLELEAQTLQQSDLLPLMELSQTKASLSEKIESFYHNVSQPFSKETLLSLAEIIELPEALSAYPKLQDQFIQALNLSHECHQLNTTNGITIQALSNINQSLLHLINGQNEESIVYGAQGKTTFSKQSSKSLGKA